MDFAFTSDQQLLKNSARAFLDEHCKPTIVRASWDDPRGDNDAMWKEMAQLGWLGLSLPEAHGGSGLGMVETAILLEEMGRAACPGAYWPTMLAAGALAEAGTDTQKKRWLPAIATGEARATIAFLDGDLDWNPDAVTTRARDARHVSSGSAIQDRPRLTGVRTTSNLMYNTMYCLPKQAGVQHLMVSDGWTHHPSASVSNPAA